MIYAQWDALLYKEKLVLTETTSTMLLREDTHERSDSNVLDTHIRHPSHIRHCEGSLEQTEKREERKSINAMPMRNLGKPVNQERKQKAASNRVEETPWDKPTA